MLSAITGWILNSWLARKLQNKKTWIFVGSIIVLVADHFLQLGLTEQLLGGEEGTNLTDGQALLAALFALAMGALKAGGNRQSKETKDMIKKQLDEVMAAARKSGPLLLLALPLIGLGCSSSNGFSLGNQLAGLQLGGTVGADEGGQLNASVTVVGQQGGAAVTVKPNDLGAGLSVGFSANVDLCAAMASIGMDQPNAFCTEPAPAPSQ